MLRDNKIVVISAFLEVNKKYIRKDILKEIYLSILKKIICTVFSRHTLTRPKIDTPTPLIRTLRNFPNENNLHIRKGIQKRDIGYILNLKKMV